MIPFLLSASVLLAILWLVARLVYAEWLARRFERMAEGCQRKHESRQMIVNIQHSIENL